MHNNNHVRQARGDCPSVTVSLVMWTAAIVSACLGVARATADELGGEGAKKKEPQIVKTVPETGAKDVDPALKEIRVTFDRDMQKGMSWTGGPPLFPPTEKKRPAKWIDKRTCVLPVKLEPDTEYRVGVNAPSFKNFRSADGTPAQPAAIEFKTKAASEANDAEQPSDGIPKIVKMEPANDATDVDPATKELKVTFDMPMDKGFSWTGSGPKYPKSPAGKKPRWSSDKLTCTLPVTLEPGHDYELGINSRSFKNFRSESGVPVEPVVYKFRTREK